jgi:hypothetical protein
MTPNAERLFRVKSAGSPFRKADPEQCFFKMLDVAIFLKLVHGDHTSPLVLSKDKKVKITKKTVPVW